MDTPAPEPRGLRARFSCQVCGELAGSTWIATPADAVDDSAAPDLQALAELDALQRPDEQAALVVETFFGASSKPVSSDSLEWVTHAIVDNDAAALYRMSYGYAPFHCPDCAACYCGEHWSWREFDDGPFTGIEGSCPNGHFHVLTY